MAKKVRKKKGPFLTPKIPHSFQFMTPVVYDPQYDPKMMTEEGKKLRGKVMLYLGDIPDADGSWSGHCAVVHEERVLWMMHPQDFRKATDKEF